MDKGDVTNKIKVVINDVNKSCKSDHWKGNKEMVATLSLIDCRYCESQHCENCPVLKVALKRLAKIEAELKEVNIEVEIK